MAGFYLMHRGWMDNDALGGAREAFCKRAAWVWLIEQSAWTEVPANIGGASLTISRGQVSHSLRFMADAWGWSLAGVQRFIETLKRKGMVAVTTDTGRTFITICNYDEYQAGPRFGDTALAQGDTLTDTPTDTLSDTRSDTAQDHATACNESSNQALSLKSDTLSDTQSDTLPDTPPDTNKNQKKEKKEREDSLRALALEHAAPAPVAPTARAARTTAEPRATRLPPDWQPVGEFATFAHSGGLNPATVGAVFRDYWCAKGGKDGRKTDWLATWRNWCRRDRNWREPPTAGGQASLLDRPATATHDVPNPRNPINQRTGRHFTDSEWLKAAGELGL